MDNVKTNDRIYNVSKYLRVYVQTTERFIFSSIYYLYFLQTLRCVQ